MTLGPVEALFFLLHVLRVDAGVHGYQMIALKYIAIVDGGASGREALQDAILHLTRACAS